MNDPAAMGSSASPAGSDPNSDAGFGATLARARQRIGMSQEQAAACIRLQPRQLAALEKEDLKALPAPAYVSGFVRNYARELKIDPAPLIEDLNRKVKAKGLVSVRQDLGPGGAELSAQSSDDRRWRQFVLAGIVLALICAALIGTWMARPGMRTHDTASHAPATSAPPSAPANPAPEPANPPPADGQGAPPGAPRGPAPGGGAQAENAPEAVPGQSDAPPSTVAVANAAPAASSEVVAKAPAPESVPAVSDATRHPSGLVLRFNDRSWFEISGTDGRVFLSRNGEAGSTELLNTSAPLRLVVGRSEAVQVEYRGRAVDLKPFSNSNGVARLLLADGRVTSGGQ